MSVISISVPDDVVKRLDDAAATAGLNRSEFVVRCVESTMRVVADTKGFQKDVGRMVIEMFERAVVVVADRVEKGLPPMPELGGVLVAMGVREMTESDERLMKMLAVDNADSTATNAHEAAPVGCVKVKATCRRPFKRLKAIPDSDEKKVFS